MKAEAVAMKPQVVAGDSKDFQEISKNIDYSDEVLSEVPEANLESPSKASRSKQRNNKQIKLVKAH